MIWSKELQDTLIHYLQNDSTLPILILSRDGFVESCNKAFKGLVHNNKKLLGLSIDDILTIHQRFKQTTSLQGYTAEPFLGSFKLANLSSMQLNGTILTNNFLKLIVFEHYLMNENQIVEQISQINIEMSSLTRTLTKKNNALEKANDKINHLLTTDYLTQIYNRRYFFEKLNDYIKNDCTSPTLCLGFISMDIDFFKKVNDTYGHDIGDIVLKSFAQTLNKYLGHNGIVARIGGEEFSAFIPTCHESHLLSLAENTRKAVENICFNQANLKITASFGLTLYHPPESIDTLIKRADTALYEAKNTGRNRIVFKRPT